MVTIAAEFPDQEATVKDFLAKKHASTKNYIFASDNKADTSRRWIRRRVEGPAAVHHHRRREGRSDLSRDGLDRFPQDAPRDRARAQSLKPWRACHPSTPPNCRLRSKPRLGRNGRPVRHLSETRQEANVCISTFSSRRRERRGTDDVAALARQYGPRFFAPPGVCSAPARQRKTCSSRCSCD